MDSIVERIEETISDTVRGLKVNVVDIEVGKYGGKTYLRITLDRPGGITVDDCAVASELIGQVIDRENLISGSYVLEIMSPGVNRPLKKARDFEMSVGKIARVRIIEPRDGRDVFRGEVTSFDGNVLSMVVDGERMEFVLEEIASARLDPDLPW